MLEEVYRLLYSRPRVRFTIKEVSKTLDREKWQEQPFWAKPFLRKLVEEKRITETQEGYFVYDPRQQEEERQRAGRS
jgi:hypothetical protein